MSANNVILAKNVNASKLKYSAPKTLSNGSRTVYISYEGDKLTLQTPLMTLPYGVSNGYQEKGADGKPKSGDDAPKKYELNVSFRGMDDNPALKALHDKLKELDKKIKDDCFENRLTWLRDDYDGMKNVVDRLYFPILKVSKDKDTGKPLDYPPTMKLKIPFDPNTDTFQFDCFDMDGNEVDFKSIKDKLNKAKARLIIQLGGLWFAGGKYGATWKVVKARFETNTKSNVDFIADDEDVGATKETHSDDDVEEDALHMANGASPIAKKKLVFDSDDEGTKTPEPEEEEEEEPVPPPAPKKAAKPAPKPREPTPEPEEEEEVEAEEEVDSELEEELPPPPPPKKTTKASTKSTARK